MADLDEQLVERLRLAIGRLTRRLRQQSFADALSPSQLSALVTAEQHGPLRPSELASREAVTPSTMTRLLEPLVAAGLLSREPDPRDARASLVRLTDAGADQLRAGRQTALRLLQERLRTLDDEQQAALLAALPALEALVQE